MPGEFRGYNPDEVSEEVKKKERIFEMSQRFNRMEAAMGEDNFIRRELVDSYVNDGAIELLEQSLIQNGYTWDSLAKPLRNNSAEESVVYNLARSLQKMDNPVLYSNTVKKIIESLDRVHGKK
jgi:hypothetical protein